MHQGMQDQGRSEVSMTSVFTGYIITDHMLNSADSYAFQVSCQAVMACDLLSHCTNHAKNRVQIAV